MSDLQTAPPLEAMAAATRLATARPDPYAARTARAAAASPLLKLADADPDAAKAVAEMRSAVRALPPRQDDAAAVLAGRRMPPTRTDGLFDDVSLRVVPYDYTGTNGGNARMYPDRETGMLSLSGKSGHIEGGLSGQVAGTCWVGTTVYSDGARPVRCAPLLNWQASWSLSVAGVPDGFFGADPWASARGGVQIQAYDGNGPVSALESREVFNQDKRGAPGADWDTNSGSDSGTPSNMNIWFDLPAGAPRWVNVLAYLDLNAAYTGAFNVAAASAGLEVKVVWIVVDWQP
ncbi:hypothetical protein AB0M28_22835 [Streptomyces sp. NPDC051940]|uniref:hypothetical protein n=1 Tax=Streptomyces sp. NPDC051940 TaxID=3155675 RepID=UPI00342C3C43